MIKVNEFNFKNNEYKIYKSFHCNECRNRSAYSRDSLITDELYNRLIKDAIKNGLRSYKGEVQISFISGPYTHSILIDYSEDKKMYFVITVLLNRSTKERPFYTHFNVDNRILLTENYNTYIFDSKGRIKGRHTKYSRKDLLEKSKDEDEFINYAKSTGIRRLK